MSLAEWLAILADVASLAALVTSGLVGRYMRKHHRDDTRHRKES